MADDTTPGWYHDPENPARLRLWDGKKWTDKTKEPGQKTEEALIDAKVDEFLAKAVTAAMAGKISDEHRHLQAAYTAAGKSPSQYRSQVRGKVRGLQGGGEVLVGSKMIGIVTAYGVTNGAEAERQSIYWRDHKGAASGALTKLMGDVLGSPIEVRTDRIIYEGKAHRLDESTRAQVFLDGSEQVTYRPTATRTLLLAPLPGSAAVGALATQKKERHDTREGSFQVSSTSWAVKTQIKPQHIQEARSIAERINRIAESLEREATRANTPAPTATPTAGVSVVEEIATLAALHQSGSLTDDEFAALKKQAIERSR